MGTMPAATAAAEPPLEPPGVRSRFQGLRVTPKARGSVKPFSANSGVLVFPMMTAPASSNRCTNVECCLGMTLRNPRLPLDVGSPA
jgi:hypothetical protein